MDWLIQSLSIIGSGCFPRPERARTLWVGIKGEINKLDDLTNVNPDIIKKNRAIEVDIKREIAIGKADINGVKSEEIKGKVNNKLDKLRKLRRK